MERAINKELESFTGKIGLYYENLNTGEVITRNEDEIFSAASTIKIPLVAKILVQAKEGKYNLNNQVELSKENRVGGSGVIILLDERYKPTILDMAKLAIVVSDNAATNQLIDIAQGLEEINDFCRSYELKNTAFQRKMMDFKALEEGKNNFTTAGEMGRFLKLIANGELHSKEVSQELIDILKAQQFNRKLPQMIPALEPDDPDVYDEKVKEGTVVIAHKTGELERTQHDVGIFFLPDGKKYVLAIYTSDLKSEEEGIDIIAKISKVIYDFNK